MSSLVLKFFPELAGDILRFLYRALPDRPLGLYRFVTRALIRGCAFRLLSGIVGFAETVRGGIVGVLWALLFRDRASWSKVGLRIVRRARMIVAGLRVGCGVLHGVARIVFVEGVMAVTVDAGTGGARRAADVAGKVANEAE